MFVLPSKSECILSHPNHGFNLQYVHIFHFVTFSSNMVIECKDERLQDHTGELSNIKLEYSSDPQGGSKYLLFSSLT